ncbi:MAG: TonB-dependent receptor domain-containing protein [Gemmatimonadaceae bacterium]
MRALCTRVTFTAAAGAIALLLIGMPVRAQAGTHDAPPSTSSLLQGTGGRAGAPLIRRVTLDLRGVRLEDALDAIDRQANLGLSYSARIVPLDKRVTINVHGVTAARALAELLAGIPVRVVTTRDGPVMLEQAPSGPPTKAEPDTIEKGAIVGVVSDSITRKPLEGATVVLQGATLTKVTNANGRYAFVVPLGTYEVRVRYLGYAPRHQRVTITIGARLARVSFTLPMLPTGLQTMVTTATGAQRRLELGNDITVLNADSIVATQPVASVTDLLQGRVPGLVIQQSSGVPGAPARLRLRGIGSVALSSDPIVIVDGIRVYSAVSNSRIQNEANSGYLTTSPLDAIDVHSIKTIEVFKGPSAAAMYGPDASGGVIVITTKQGQQGPPRWTASYDQGTNYIAGKYPLNYIRFGHSVFDNTPMPCPLASTGSCVPDSLVTFQLLNDPTVSPFTSSSQSTGTVGVSGGVGGLSYSLSGHLRRDDGTIRLPQFEYNQYQAQEGVAPPGWMSHPDGLTEWGETGSLTSALGSKATVSLTTMLTRQEQQQSSVQGQLDGLMHTYLNRATGQYYQVDPGTASGFGTAGNSIFNDYATRVQSASTNMTTALTVGWHPASWLTTSVSGGINYISRQDNSFEPAGINVPYDSAGAIANGSASSLVNTLNVQATTQTDHLPFGVHMQLAVGANYSGTSTSDNSVHASGVPQGATSIAQAATLENANQNSSDVTSLGVFASPQLHWHQLWLNTGLRMDGGSSYGTAVHLVAFPKISLSYLVSDEHWFPQSLKRTFDDLRLRASYGKAGRVPTPEERLRTYSLVAGTFDGGPVDQATLNALGNVDLQPEQTNEFDAGVDADLFSGLLSLSFSGYRKVTANAILSTPVPPSVYGNATMPINVGSIRNEGFDATLGVDLLRTPLVTWHEQLMVSHNTNVLTALNHAAATQGFIPVTLKQGYPVDGQWARPLLGYTDRNHDGIIEPNEVLMGDTAVYMGSAQPPYSGSVQTTVGVLHNAVTLSMGLDFQAHFVQTNDYTQGVLRGYNDPMAPLAEQAWAESFNGGISASYGNLQQVSELRLSTLAISWRVPRRFARFAGTSSLSMSLLGTNLWLDTNYRGKDPNVNGGYGVATGFTLSDSGTLPQPRSYGLRINAAY